MSDETDANSQKRIGRWVSFVIVAAAAALGLIVIHQATRHPRTDDATVLANYIGIAPQVEGPLIRLAVHDNQFVKKGELLFEIDDRPYQYTLERTLSEQAALEGQITDEQRKIAALQSAVAVADANIHSAEADVAVAEQDVERAQAEWAYASNNLQRLEPLLTNHFVTEDDIDKAKTTEIAHQDALREAQSHLVLVRSELKSAQAQHEQAAHAVTTLDPLTSQRGAREAAVKRARYDAENCRVCSPFDARVTNLTISEGAYAHVGQQMFVLIDARRWWAVANFREGQLEHIKPGMKADVYVMSKSDRRFIGYVDSIGYGVTPDADVIGSYGNGLPDVQRTLNWVHLSSRYPVRVRIENPEPELFRVSESAVVIIRGN
jgi:multidrug efflux system membrane fusion protein